ncbi:MAG: FecR/PupR family sigma factor regulator, partial [Opitutaceae bacterium]
MSRATKNYIVEGVEEAAATWVFRRAAGLTPEELAAFERWQAEDPRHRAVLARHERAWSALDRPRQAGQADFMLGKLAERASRRRGRRAGVISAAFA